MYALLFITEIKIDTWCLTPTLSDPVSGLNYFLEVLECSMHTTKNISQNLSSQVVENVEWKY